MRGDAVPRGGKADAASTAWRHALRAEPQMVEAHLMLAMRPSRAAGKKPGKQARQHASKALALAPHSGTNPTTPPSLPSTLPAGWQFVQPS